MDEINLIVLRKIMEHLIKTLDSEIMIELNDKIKCLNDYCRGDGCGLMGGTLTDMFIIKFFELKISTFKECHENEADFLIHGEKMSFKKINGKSSIALNWSKNSSTDKKEKFTENIMIVNLKTCQWWKCKPPKNVPIHIDFKKVIPSGIYIVDKYYCKKNIELTTNNKTNSLIDSKNLYMMLYNSIENNLFIPLPEQKNTYKFDILSSFVK